MASRVGTVLSDAHILKHCALYQPIPMNMANTVLKKDLNIHTTTPFTSKKLKYHNSVSRPASFNTLVNSLTRVSGGDLRIRDHLINTYTTEMNKPPASTMQVPPLTSMPPVPPQPASITPRSNRHVNLTQYSNSIDSGSVTNGGSSADSDDLNTRASMLFNEINNDADMQSNPRTPRTLDHEIPSDMEGYSSGYDEAMGNWVAQMHHMGPISPFSFQQPLVTAPAGTSTDHASTITDPAEYTALVGEGYGPMFSQQQMDSFDAMARMNEDNAANPKTPGSKSTYFDA